MNKVIQYIQYNQKRVFKTCTAVQRQNAASAHFTRKQSRVSYVPAIMTIYIILYIDYSIHNLLEK